MGTTAAAQLAAFAASLRLEDVPPHTVGRARIALIDAMGAALYGQRGAASRIVLAEAFNRYREGPATLWGTSTPGMHPAGAALVNGTRAHEFELDDYVPPAKLHPAAVLAPVVLAVGQVVRPPGAELLTAFIAGYDIMVRVSLAANSAATRARGWHMTGVAGPLGAAAAAARLLGLDDVGITRALGIAGSHAGGLFAFTAEGSMTKAYHAGKSAEAGIVAAELARLGFEGPSGVFDADDGGLLRAVSDRSDAGRLTDGLGRRFEIDGAAIKPYPACGSIHSSIDAMLGIVRDGVHAEEIDSVVIGNSSFALQQCGFEYTGRGGMLEARMSMQFCVAAAAVDGAVGLKQFEDARRTDDRIVELASRVRFEVDERIDAVYPHHYPSRLRVILKDGTEVERFVADPTGSPGNPISEAQVLDKFFELSEQSGVDAAALVDAVWALDAASDLDALVAALCSVGDPRARREAWLDGGE